MHHKETEREGSDLLSPSPYPLKHNCKEMEKDRFIWPCLSPPLQYYGTVKKINRLKTLEDQI